MSDWREVRLQAEADINIAVVGQGVESTLLPVLHSTAFQRMGLSAQIECLDVEPSQFEECIRHLASLKFKGASVTNPHKVEAARIAERFWVVKHSLGVANTLTFTGSIFAQNTEVSAFVQTVSHLEPSRALVLGAGHGARSVVLGLMESGWKVRVWNRSAMKTRVLLTLMKRYGDIELATQPDPTNCKLIVNTTPLGTKIGEQPPLLWQYVPRGAVFYDLAYRRISTEFLRNAAVRGLKGIDGRELVVEQAAQAIEWWTDKEAPREVMRTAVGLGKGLGMSGSVY